MKVGILTFFRPLNNGAVLQACATNRIVLKKLGVESELIDYRLPRIEVQRADPDFGVALKRKEVIQKLKGIAGVLLLSAIERKRRKIFDGFIKKHLVTSVPLCVRIDVSERQKFLW